METTPLLIVSPTMFVLVGVVLWLISPTIEDRFGSISCDSALIGGLFCVIVALIVSVAQVNVFGITASLLVLIWSGLTYLLFVIRRRGHEHPPPSREASHRCQTRLIHGSYTPEHDEELSWRTFLEYRFECTPTDCSLEQNVWITAGAFYGLFFRITIPPIVIESALDIFCVKAKTVTIYAEKRRNTISERSMSVGRGLIQSDIKRIDDRTISADIVMTASRLATGGGGGSAHGVSVSLPEAPGVVAKSMGSYVWMLEN